MEKKYDLIYTIISIWNFKFLFSFFFIFIYLLIFYFFLVDGNSYKSSIQFKQSNTLSVKNFESSSENLFLLFIKNLNNLESFSDTQSLMSDNNLEKELYESLYQSAELDLDEYVHSISNINMNISSNALKQFHLNLFETINTNIVTNEINEVIMPIIDSRKNELNVINTINYRDIENDLTSQNNIFILDDREKNQQIIKLNAEIYDLEYKLDKLKLSSNSKNHVVEYYPDQITIKNLNNFNLIIVFGFIVSFLVSAIITALFAIIYKRLN